MLRRALVSITSRLGSVAVCTRFGHLRHLHSPYSLSRDLLGRLPCSKGRRGQSSSKDTRESIYRMISSAAGPDGASKAPSPEDTPKSR